MDQIAGLRTQLRAVNIEYSILVKRKPVESVCRRMSVLRAHRQVLLSLIAVHWRHAPKERVSRHALSVPLRSAGEKVHKSRSTHPLGPCARF